MIWYYLILFITSLLNAVFSWLPTVEVLPLGMDSALTTSVGYFRGLMSIFPPFETLFIVAFWYLSFKLVLVVLKFFIGHRAPVNL